MGTQDKSYALYLRSKILICIYRIVFFCYFYLLLQIKQILFCIFLDLSILLKLFSFLSLINETLYYCAHSFSDRLSRFGIHFSFVISFSWERIFKRADYVGRNRDAWKEVLRRPKSDIWLFRAGVGTRV